MADPNEGLDGGAAHPPGHGPALPGPLPAG